MSAVRDLARLPGAERRRLLLAVLLGFGAVASAAGLLAMAGYLISRAAQRPHVLALTVVIVVVPALAIARAALRYAERIASHALALRMLARLRVRFYRVLAPLVPASLKGETGGELLSRFVADVDTLQDLYLRALAPPIVAVLVIATAGLAAWLLLPAAGIAVAGSLLVTAVAVSAIAAVIASAAGRRQASARAALTAELVEVIDGGAELAVAGRGEERVARLRGADLRLASVARCDGLAAAAASALGALLTGGALLAVLLVAIPAVHSGVLDGVLLAALVFLVLGAFEGLAPLPAAARRLHACAEAARRLHAIEALTPVVRDPERPRTLRGEGPDPLIVHDVSFRYGPGEPWLLRDVDLRLAPGLRTALVGPSGVGKTTLARLLVRFVDPVAGRVTLGGIDLRELAQDEVRESVLLAAQDARVFTATIRENLLLARESASDAELWSALEATRLDDLVRALPDGLDTLVGEDGELFSGGERQRISLARALLSDARFLILDEPTAYLDPELAEEVMHRLFAAARNRGLLVITHLHEGLERFDQVLELKDGRIEPLVQLLHVPAARSRGPRARARQGSAPAPAIP